MDIPLTEDFNWIPDDPNEAMRNIGILFDEFLDEVGKLRTIGDQKQVENIKIAFNNYSQYSQQVEKRFIWNIWPEERLLSIIDFRKEKEEILQLLLRKYSEWEIPGITTLVWWSSIFTCRIPVIMKQKLRIVIFLWVIKQKVFHIFHP